jgi:RNA polymerase sigma-70 factor (ECF subfamily)
MNTSAWERAFVEQLPRLRRYARSLVGNRQQADDLVQDCLERAWRHIDKWREGSDLRAWLFTIMHNVYVNQVRRTRSGPGFVPLDESDAPQCGGMPQENLLRDVEAGLMSLTPEQREVLLLAGLEQLSYGEIAEILDIPAGTVMSRLARARDRLRVFLSDSQSQPLLRRVK